MAVVCPDEASADSMANDLRFFAVASGQSQGGEDIVRLPCEEILPYDDGSISRDVLISRMAALDVLHRGRAHVLVLSAAALSRRLPPPEIAKQHGFAVSVGDTVDRDDIARGMGLAGYQNVPLVEDPGTFALRGGIIDLWPPRSELPVRVELFGDEVDSLRTFNPETQRTIASLEVLETGPAHQVLFTEDTIRHATTQVRVLAGELGVPASQVRGIIEEIREARSFLGIESLLPAFYEGGLVPLSSWLEDFDVVIMSDPAGCSEELLRIWSHARAAYLEARGRGEVVFPPESHYLDPDAAMASLEYLRRVDIHELLIGGPGDKAIRFEARPIDDLRREFLGLGEESRSLAPLVKRLGKWRKKNLTVALACGSPGQVDRFQRLLEDREVAAYPAGGPLDPLEPARLGHETVDIHLLNGNLSSGFEDPSAGLVLLAEADLLGRRLERRPSRVRQERTGEAFTESFSDLTVGDLVVHTDHGIGKYLGLTRLEIGEVAGDFLLIEYSGGDKIYLPVHRLGRVQRYVGTPDAVRLDRLGGQSFELRKKKVKEELLKMAAELLDIYAARKAHPGTAFSPPDAVYREFEAVFPYDETEDQARAVEEVVEDMQKPEPMDRLICGDVGYGKTEVAMRAAMKAVLDGKQVAVLVPTTVLAAQHDQTFKERFRNYPVIIEAVSRFQSKSTTEDILRRTSEGRVDILIGTHRLLSRDLAFKELGLLVIDEEQRFGVAQKERLKRLRRQVDVLTLTATPIPRTLHMSLSGIRDLSVIATAPADRRSIRTFVSRFDADVIREAASREISRGGQVFFVHNRVQSIGAMAEYLRRLLPEARILVAHGQMNERALEKTMSRFVAGEADLLLSSSIIESGLDIPAVNTIILNRADTFGLAQLYQLRGRVGRSSDRAYCYLLIPARRPVTPKAKQRLAALQQLTELGSGFRLAGHDMEIRGAGSLLGRQQSGHITAIGFDLYVEMLEEAVRELKGEAPQDDLEPEVNLPIPAYLPEEYVPDVHQRLSFYKRLAQARVPEVLEDLRAELIDRYGRLPVEAGYLLDMRALTQALARIGMAALDTGPARLIITPGPRSTSPPNSSRTPLSGGRIVERIPQNLTPEELISRAMELIEHVSRKLDQERSTATGPKLSHQNEEHSLRGTPRYVVKRRSRR